ncbi:hypothetical protein PVA45_06945 [Entomospira entomophila]|uniref:Uncharacterized protein n=1 Tax=Entomospira entomophila TaxID=2719988 RepID=A0A968G9T7_9SPIO|nr:hypothetical protein [Entomospira entomophilus]NIZ41238.1 hypothetical protein [Entomospira entomophilus]WDI35443.1 hypothetical protein PVA45_06945 [Entomospira entomophilus]
MLLKLLFLFTLLLFMGVYQRWKPRPKSLPKLISEDTIRLIPRKMLKRNLLARTENWRSHRLVGERELIPFPPMSITDSHVYAYALDWNIWIVKHIPQIDFPIENQDPHYTLLWERYYYHHLDYCLSYEQKWLEYPIVLSSYDKKRTLIQSVVLDADIEQSWLEKVPPYSRGYTVMMAVKLPPEWLTYIGQSDRLKIEPFERDAIWVYNLQGSSEQYWLTVLSLIKRPPHWIGEIQ